MSFELNVKDIINTSYLKGISRVIAGKGGMDRPVKWVHILEIRDIIKDCVNGEELILTTGIGFTSKDIAISFFKELIACNVSGICLETALYYHVIDKELIELADQSQVPLIEIPEISRFIDISRGLNTLILNQDLGIYNNADRYEDNLQAINGKGSLMDGIAYTAEYLGVEVAYIPNSGKQYVTSNKLKAFIQEKIGLLEGYVRDGDVYSAGNIAVKKLSMMGKQFGYLIFCSGRRQITQFDNVILGRLATKLKRDIYIEMLRAEEILYRDNVWVGHWLEGELSESEIREYLLQAGISKTIENIYVCGIGTKEKYQSDYQKTIDNVQAADEFAAHVFFTIKNTLERAGIYVLHHCDDNQRVCIIMVPANVEGYLAKLETQMTNIARCEDEFVDFKNLLFAFGKKVKNVNDVKKSLSTGKWLLGKMNDKTGNLAMYDALHLSRIMENVKKRTILEDMIEDYLGDLIQPSNEDLLNTLKTYYECNCSKQKTAEILYIARQTLYFRLDKIQAILGNDFDYGDRKFAIEFAVRAFYYFRS